MNHMSDNNMEKWIKKYREYREEQLEELKRMADEYDVVFPDGIQDTEIGDVRRPLVLVRGKPVTVEQAMQLITGEEPLFREPSDCECGGFDRRETRGVLKNIFYRSGYDWLSTWVYTDGTIGGDLISLERYPELDEILPDYFHLARTYPFLDLVISYTTYDESCCYWCETKELSECKCKDCRPYLEKIILYDGGEWNRNPDFEELYFRSWLGSHVKSDVGDSVELTIWVHCGKTEILFGEKAAAKFKEYNRLYCAPEYDFMFTSDLYQYDRTCICSKSYVEDCFACMGKPRSLCDEYIKKGFIKPFNEEAEIITKDWVINQYNRYILRRRHRKQRKE